MEKVIHPFIVSYSVGATINVGDYESRRIQIGLSVPVYKKEKIRPVLDAIEKLVEEELESKIKEIRETKKAKIEDIEEIIEEDL